MRIPLNAKRVFKGIIFDVYQWQQEMFDGRHRTFELIKRSDSVQVIAVQGDKIILCDDEQPGRPRKTTFLGGRVNEHEVAVEGGKRELLEEAGMESDDWELFATYNPFTKIEWSVHYFIARGCREVASLALDPGGERITLKPVTFEEFMKIVASEEFDAGKFTADMLRLQQDKKALAVFRKRLFGNS